MHGSGYVGLVLAVCLANQGHDVLCVDINPERIKTLNAGEVPFFEPKVSELLLEGLANGKLHFITNIAEAVKHGEIQFIAVGTPPLLTGKANLQYIDSVAESIGKHLEFPATIVTKSTVPVGTATRIKSTITRQLNSRQVDIDFDVASNPEFLREGSAVSDFMKPDRTVIGVYNSKVTEVLKEVFSFLDEENFIDTNTATSELAKYGANTYLAMKISFINEMARLAGALDIDVKELIDHIPSKSISKGHLNPGCGYGGSCFPKDVAALAHQADDLRLQLNIIPSITTTNKKQQLILVDKLKAFFNGNIVGKTIAIWGLAFKANTDDSRFSPSLAIIDALLAEGCIIKAYDPQARTSIDNYYQSTEKQPLLKSPVEATQDADVLFVLTERPEFKVQNFSEIADNLKAKVVFDGRNFLNQTLIEEAGCRYFGIGRGRTQLLSPKLPLTTITKPLFSTDKTVRTIALASLATEVFFAMEASFLHEATQIAELSFANIDDIKKILISDHRISSAFLTKETCNDNFFFLERVMNLALLASELKVDLHLIPAILKTAIACKASHEQDSPRIQRSKSIPNLTSAYSSFFLHKPAHSNPKQTLSQSLSQIKPT